MRDPLSTTPVASTANRPAPPTTVPVGQRFEMLGRIGAGNHGVVFRARDSQLQREVAIKRFSHFVADDPRAMRRITREVATLARVSHRNVVTVHDLVHMPDGDGEITPHLVMELVEGTSLRDLLNRQGPSLRSVIVVRGVLEGLVACHEAGILHLDIKPANVLVTSDGGVKIVDFGIARAASDATATVAGTPHYMAPEQFDGRADERSDIYSVGCLLYECLTGVPPFQGTMATQLMAHRHEPRPDPRDITPQVSASLVAVVHRAMAVEPTERFPSVQEMLAALAEVGDGLDLNQPARSAGPATAAVVVPQGHGPSVTRWTKLQTFSVGLALSAFIVALVPGLVWLSMDLVPYDFHPPAMRDAGAGGWWMLAVGFAVVFLLLRRRTFLPSLSGPAVGEPLPPGRIDASMRSGLRTAVGAALRGSVPILFPAYVASVSALVEVGGLQWPDDVFGTGWGTAWVLMPLAALALALRSVTRVRLRFGSMFMAMIYLAGAMLAAVLFVAYPYAL
ncbi:serine/threonine-protein kinase [Aeromicrobium sp. P5_D10]